MTSSTICSHHRIRTVLLMCVVLLSASLHAQAQNKETRINLNIRNATLESFVKQLENATGFSFIYGEEVKLTHRITLEMKQKNISEILQRAFVNPEKPDVPLNKNDAFQKVQKRRVQEKR